MILINFLKRKIFIRCLLGMHIWEYKERIGFFDTGTWDPIRTVKYRICKRCGREEQTNNGLKEFKLPRSGRYTR